MKTTALAQATSGLTIIASRVLVDSSRSTCGSLLMILAMFCIPFVDGLAKHLSASYSLLFLGWARYAVASLIVLPIATIIHGRSPFPTERQASHVWRTLFLVSAMTLYFLSLARVPLATAASGYLVGPVIAVVLSIVVLRERVTGGRIAGLALGATGSFVIVGPGGSMDPGILLALGAGVLFALYLVTTRQAAQASDPVRTLALQCVVGTLLLTPQAVATWRTPALDDVLLFAGLGGISALSHVLSILAFRLAPASRLAPLVYVELVGAALIGYLMFDEVPTASTIVGAGFIIAAGLVLLDEKPRAELRPRVPLQAQTM